ncbi:MAG: 4-aminobutyrate aminotransferase [Acidimicrobiaceae bacterium]|jgi:4-aminobutyrate aminotransferase
MSAVSQSTLTADWMQRYDHAMASVLPGYFSILAERGEGSWLIDVEGRRFLDFGSGIGVTNVGHCHPLVVAAIERQARMLIHTSVVARHGPAIELAERLGALVPFIDEPRVFFCNSGAEAVDGALKLSRRTTGRGGVIAFTGGFHGRTLAATTLTTTKAKYREGYDPLLPSVFHAPYGNAPDALEALDALLDTHGNEIGCMIAEPVLGEGGYVVPPMAWLRGLRRRCSDHGIVLVFDEVQCGMGRTGRPFAAETFGVTPDVVLFAKGIASGLPLGGIIAGRELMDRWPHGTHGSTFGGNPVACAAALATLDALERGNCYARAEEMGAVARTRLAAAAAANPAAVRDVRGIGLMIGVELRDGDAAAVVQRRCFDDGLLVLTCGPDDNVLRLIPPLTISDGELEQGLAILINALTIVR